MKITTTLLALAATVSFSSAAVVFTGTAARDLNADAAGTVTLPVGTVGFLVADIDGNGFGATLPNAILPNASIALGSLFGGDRIFARMVSSASFGGSITGAANFNITSDGAPNPALPTVPDGAAFAVVWLPGVTDAGATTVAAGQIFGLGTDSSWLIPSQNGVSRGFTTGATSTTSPFRSLDDTPTNGAAVTPNPVYTVVPEPSTAALGLLAGLGLVARRRRA